MVPFLAHPVCDGLLVSESAVPEQYAVFFLSVHICLFLLSVSVFMTNKRVHKPILECTRCKLKR